MANSSKKPDKELFSGFNPPAATPLQRVVPIKDTEDTIEQILFRVPGEFKKEVKIYIANKKMSITDFFVEAAKQFINNNP